ncbi:hypothetical protein IT575_07645 [bacterium]|nr:hypothetical protein [bacterium]
MFEKTEASLLTHLGLIQGIISRLSGNSVTIKNFAITIVTALAAAAITAHSTALMLVSVIPLIAFAVTDAYYVYVERSFIELYNSVRLGQLEDTSDFMTMDYHQVKTRVSYFAALTAPSVLPFYVVLLAGVAAFTILIAFTHAADLGSAT